MSRNNNYRDNRNNNTNHQTNKQKQRSNQRKEGNRSNYRRNSYHKRSSRYNSDSLVARIANPKREETIEDIQMDIEKLEKDIQFEIKQIRSTKLGL